jgi:formylglycine-generating enzyme required for sulfatase activity
LLGNVWEWCWDGYEEKYYAQSPDVDPIGALGGFARVIRGGSWRDNPQIARSAFRSEYTPGSRGNALEFFLARGQSRQ